MLAYRSIFAVVLLVVAACKAPPARLVAGHADTVIVNNLRPVRIPVRGLDAAGRKVETTGVRYQWIAGAPVSVSSTGVVTCTQPGDATVRASLGALITRVVVRCRPVSEVRAPGHIDLVVGAPAQDLAFEALGIDSQSVDLVAAKITVDDSTIATVNGSRIRGRAPGGTSVTIRVGNRQSFASVEVYERRATPEGMRPGQRVAVPVRVADGQIRRWRLAASREVYFLTMLPDRDAAHVPAIAVLGANCAEPINPYTYFCLAQHDASIIVYNPQQSDPTRELSGMLAIRRQERP